MSNDPKAAKAKTSKEAASLSAPGAAYDAPTVRDRLQKFVPGLEGEALIKLVYFYFELLRFNSSMSLISATTIKTADVVHIVDSALASRIIAPKLLANEPLYDLGSGNGCPGLVFAILFPQLPVVLVERDLRKMEFLKHIISYLRVPNVTTLSSNLEEMPEGKLKNVVSRGLAPLHKALMMTRKQVGVNGRYFHLKGDGWANELASVPSQLFSFWSPSLAGQYKLPELKSDMAVILTEKIGN